jgi:hypothetical protein
MELLHAPDEDFNAFNFPSQDIMRFVKGFRDHKGVVSRAADDMDETQILTDFDIKEDNRKTQHFYSDIINRSRAKRMEELVKDHGDPIEKASFLSNDGSFAGAFLFNIPRDTHSTMSNKEFQAALKMRLHISFNTLLSTCCCDNHVKLCSHGIHLFSCNEFKHFSLMRHDAIQYDLKQLGIQGSINVIDSGLGQLLEHDGRKGDLLFKGMGTNGRDLMIDISIGNAMASSYLHNSAHISKYVLNLLENNKNTKYRDHYRAAGIDFKPITFEMHGQTSNVFTEFFKKLVRNAADVNDIHYSLMFNYWKIRISTTMQRYNAKILYMTQNKIARVSGLLRNGDVDLNDIVASERHVNNM